MTKVKVGDTTFDIRSDMFSPYLTSLIKNLSRRRVDTTTIHLNSVDKDLFSNYVEFLNGNNFRMDSDDEMFFASMGHHNDHEYPLHIWKYKLLSSYIRHHSHLFTNKPHILVEVPIVNQPLFTLPDSMMFAGGYALYLGGYTTTYEDIDIFPLNKDDALSFIREKGLSIHTMRVSYGNIDGCMVQVIRDTFTSPYHVVYSFDIDCTGFVCTFKDGVPTLYATPLALHSVTNKEIYFGREMTDKRYYWRVHKYKNRGFDVRLPICPDSVPQNNSTIGSLIGTLVHGTTTDDYVESVIGPYISVKSYDGEKEEENNYDPEMWWGHSALGKNGILREPYLSKYHIIDIRTLVYLLDHADEELYL